MTTTEQMKGLTKRRRADGPDDGPGDMREMPKWSLLVLDMYLTTG